MKAKCSIALAVALVTVMPANAGGKKRHLPDRAILEKMEAVPCGAKQKGLSGLGSFWASVGITDIHSNEKLCPQYVVRTDDMDYRVQPANLKHPDVLPIGQEVVFKIEKDHMLMGLADSGKNNMKKYEVVAMDQAKPVNASARSESQ
jgi:hypothetical protein